jgi:hypothetical protein
VHPAGDVDRAGSGFLDRREFLGQRGGLVRLQRSQQCVEAIRDGLAAPQNQDEIAHIPILSPHSVGARTPSPGKYVR